MKKIVVILSMVAIMFAPAALKAGGVYDGPEKGTSIIGVRLGLSNIVGANVTYDYALAKVWKGTFTIGGQVGYMWNGDNSKSFGVNLRNNYNYIDMRIRTTYRLNVVVPEWEVYAGVGLGGGVSMHSNEVMVQEETITERNNNGYFSGAFILGTSYHFTEKIGLNLEFDFGNWEAAWVNIGVQIKL